MNPTHGRNVRGLIAIVGAGLPMSCHMDMEANVLTAELDRDNAALSAPATTVSRTTRFEEPGELRFAPPTWEDYYDLADERCVHERKIGGFPVETIRLVGGGSDLRYRCIASGAHATSVRRDPIVFPPPSSWAQSNQSGRSKCIPDNYDGGFLANVTGTAMRLVCVHASRILTPRRDILERGWQEDLGMNEWDTASLVAEKTCGQRGYAGGGFFDGTSEGTGENLVYGVLCFNTEE